MFIDGNSSIGALGSYRSSSGMVVGLKGSVSEGRHSVQGDEPTKISGDDSILNEGEGIGYLRKVRTCLN